jgi:hypothetical protein
MLSEHKRIHDREIQETKMSRKESMEMSTHEPTSMQPRHDATAPDGNLYMQTNELRNAVVHYRRSYNGKINEVERTSTGGAGSGEFKPISGQESAPNAFEGAGSLILSPDRRFLFATNGGDNSVSSFAVDDDGRLTLLDVTQTGNAVEGRSGTAKSLAYAASTRTLYVLHSFGPDHIRLLSMDADGKLTVRRERYTVNTHDKPNRVSTMIVLSPNGDHVFVGTTFDEPASTNPDGSPILWVRRPGGSLRSIASNAPDPDGLAVFPVEADGSLGTAKFHDANGGSPFYIAFLHGKPNTFVIGEAVGVVLAGRLARRPHRVRDELRLQQHQQLPHQREGSRGRERSRVPESKWRWHLPSAQRNRQQRPERHLDHAGRRLRVPDLRERLEASGLRRSVGRVVERDHHRKHPVQQPAGFGRILIPSRRRDGRVECRDQPRTVAARHSTRSEVLRKR